MELEPAGAHAARLDDDHAMYERLGFIVVSGKMSAAKTKGEWKKKFAFPRGWQTTETREYDKQATGFALITGARSGITAIDIDDPDTPNNTRLMRLMADCTLVARTKKGFHYVFRYDPRILQTAGDKLDTRNDGGCIFVAPSVAYDDAGRTVAEYRWVTTPRADDGLDGSSGLVAVPEPVIEFLRALDGRYVRAPPNAPTIVTAPTAPTAPATPTAPRAQTAPKAPRTAPTAPKPTTTIEARDGELMAQALRAAQARAGADRVGFPTRVVELDGKPDVFGVTAVRVDFSHPSGTARVCPISRMEHESNHFCVTLGTEERTGLPALFMYCHSVKDCNAEKKYEMLAFVDPASYETIGVDAEIADVTTPLSIGQSAVLLGKMQLQVDRLMENPGGAWDTVVTVGEIACALCTAASKHPGALALASEMLAQLLGVSRMSEDQKEHAARGFQHAKTTHDPLTKVRGLAEGLSGKREQELMVIRDAIVANTDAALEADVPKAAEHMLAVLDYCERLDSHGKVQSLANFEDMGLFLYFVWRRVARFGYDRTQSSAAHQWTFYLFNGATYERGQFEQLEIKAKRHMRSIVDALAANVQLKSRVSNLEVKCDAENFVSRAIAEMQLSFKAVEQLGWCGLVSPNDFQLKLDTGNYIGFKNGVYDILHDRFLPRGSVPLNVLVSMCTNYDYVGPDDPKFPEMRAQIEEYYRKLHADNYDDPNDERLVAMWLLAGSLLLRGNVCKKAFVFFGEGDNGISTFTTLLHLTLGDYAAAGSPAELVDTSCDPHAGRLVCVFPETEATAISACCARNRSKPIMLARTRPPAARWIWAAEFKSTFVEGLDQADVERRRYPRIADLQATLRAWAPYHFLMMLEAHRAFRVVGSLPPLEGDETRAVSPVRSARQGAVYAFATPSMAGIVKIGATDRDVAERLRDANASDTWRPPEPYAVVCAVYVEDAFAIERAIHTLLAARRIHARREFFRVTVEEARAVFALYSCVLV
jgi:hypothetical protein